MRDKRGTHNWHTLPLIIGARLRRAGLGPRKCHQEGLTRGLTRRARSRALQIRDFRGIWVKANEACRLPHNWHTLPFIIGARLRRAGLEPRKCHQEGLTRRARSRALQIRDFRGIWVKVNEACRLPHNWYTLPFIIGPRLRHPGLEPRKCHQEGLTRRARSRALQMRDFRGIWVKANAERFPRNPCQLPITRRGGGVNVYHP